MSLNFHPRFDPRTFEPQIVLCEAARSPVRGVHAPLPRSSTGALGEVRP